MQVPHYAFVMARSTTVVHPAVNGTVEGSNPSEPVPLLCNGSTGDFGSSSYGSNPYEGIRHLSTAVVQFTCNEQVIGSNPIGGFRECTQAANEGRL